MAYTYSDKRVNPITGAISSRALDPEIHTIAELDNLPGVYGVQLKDGIVQGTLTVTENVTGGAVFVQVTTAPLAGQVGVTYSGGINKRGLLLFNVADAGTEVVVDYDGVGSVNSISNIEGLVDENHYTISEVDALIGAAGQGILDSIGTTRGSILYRGASEWAIRTPGTSGQVLMSNGAGADPSYGTPTVPGVRVLGQTFSTDSAAANAANDLLASKWTALASVAVTAVTISLYQGTTGAKLTAGIYSDSSNAPATLLGQTAEYTILSTDLDVELLLTLTSPVTLTRGSRYWVAWIGNTAASLFDVSATARATHCVYKAAYGYTATLPATFPTGLTAGYQKAVGAIT